MRKKLSKNAEIRERIRKRIEKRKAEIKLKRNVNSMAFKFSPFSLKQKKLLSWWHKDSPVKDQDGIVAEGAVRSGKTMAMTLSFLLWSMTNFNDVNFGMAGKTISSFRRNVLKDFKKFARARGYKIREKRNENMIIVRNGNIENYYYIFGGKDEGSQDLVQGITTAGFFFDEVALQTKSFVDQARARCSVEGSKQWFNCNPSSPYHWFKTEFINDLITQKLLHLHFKMEDNLSLSKAVIERYKRMFTGVFYKRYIEGLWVQAEGLVYSLFGENHTTKKEIKASDMDELYMSCDYGDNATTIELGGIKNGILHMIDEFFHSGVKSGISKSDSELVEEVKKMKEKHGITKRINFILDTNAKSFKTALNKAKIVFTKNPKKKDNLINGIRQVQDLIYKGLLVVSNKCKELIKEFSVYGWDIKAANRGEDRPIKDNDHCMDAIRYLVSTLAVKLLGETGSDRAILGF